MRATPGSSPEAGDGHERQHHPLSCGQATRFFGLKAVRTDNQREASEAYIKSQAHEGWKLVRERYDDGGFSGGSMERPAVQKLLDDVRARKIDVIVVYKVDRLTRSLADFAKLVELFDAHGVSMTRRAVSVATKRQKGPGTRNVTPS